MRSFKRLDEAQAISFRFKGQGQGERYMEAINACPHHGFDTWLLAKMYTLNEDTDMKEKIAAMVVGDFFGDQKSINAQVRQEIESINKMMDGMKNDLSQKIDNLQYSISRLTNLNIVQEKGKFPSQPHQNPKGIHEVEAQKGESSQGEGSQSSDHSKGVGKEVDLPTFKPKHEPESEAEKEKRGEIKGKRKGNGIKKENNEAIVNEEPERTINQEEMIKKHMPP
ncbi:hypothetical protein CK203_108806 [Vitis vinifera]|uniref:Retrotransposon gag domain-containing protein n=1 Tax=Vitis vinifera TaxID=29760 RepID=A0A438BP65_VITVI|nr:hypothetical protein CK203_108806 [Vitis vinifera]